MNKPLAETPQSPYYAVVFTSVRTTVDEAGYGEMAACMLELAARQPGYLGVESVRDGYGVGITVSYWTDLGAIHHWREVADIARPSSSGTKWYQQYRLRICRVESDYGFTAATDD